jgi:hypothetical protein
MRERSPRLSRKLNSNDRKAMLRIIKVLPRNCMAALQILKLHLPSREQVKGHITTACKWLFHKGLSGTGGAKAA